MGNVWFKQFVILACRIVGRQGPKTHHYLTIRSSFPIDSRASAVLLLLPLLLVYYYYYYYTELIRPSGQTYKETARDS